MNPEELSGILSFSTVGLIWASAETSLSSHYFKKNYWSTVNLVQLIYSMLVSSMQQSESCLLFCFRFLSWVGCHRVLSRVPCSHSGFSLVTYFHIAVHLCQPRSPHIPLLLLILWKFVFYMHDSTSVLWRSSLYPFLLYSTYKQYHMLFVFLCLTYFTQYENH